MPSRIVLLIQARMSSQRLYGKVLKKVLGIPLLYYQYSRLSKIKAISQICVATSFDFDDDKIADFCQKNNFCYFRGDLDNVVARFFKAALLFKATDIIRITADCPLLDAETVNELITKYKLGNYDYAANAVGAGAYLQKVTKFPEGFDSEIFKFRALEYAFKHAQTDDARQHVTMLIWKNKDFRKKLISPLKDLSNFRLTVDYREDFWLIKKIIESLYPTNPDFKLADIINFLKAHPTLKEINEKYRGLESYENLN